MGQSKKDALLKVFRKLPQQIIWKWEGGDEFKDKPKNLFVSQWLPQQDILGHNNTKLFITHGGQSSVQESWCHKVPMVNVPW